MTHNSQHHLIFFSALQLQKLTEAKVWYIDGTFKVVQEPFVQLTSIHSFIRSSEVPLCFAGMSRRKSSDYKAVFNALIDLIPTKPEVQQMVLGFERVMWWAIDHCFPTVLIRACWFHWAQAVSRKVIAKS